MATYNRDIHTVEKASAFLVRGGYWVDVEPGSVEVFENGGATGVAWRDGYGDIYMTVSKEIVAMRWDRGESL